jgi:hypothetical protein
VTIVVFLHRAADKILYAYRGEVCVIFLDIYNISGTILYSLVF